jgi:hypothetical protein
MGPEGARQSRKVLKYLLMNSLRGITCNNKSSSINIYPIYLKKELQSHYAFEVRKQGYAPAAVSAI